MRAPARRAGLSRLRGAARCSRSARGSGGNLLEPAAARLSRPSTSAGIELLRRAPCERRARACPRRCAWSAATRPPCRSRRQASTSCCQATVFSSLLDDAFQERLARGDVGGGQARRRRALVRLHRRQPAQRRRARRAAGARSRAVSRRRGSTWRRVTLAPPIARAVCRLHPGLYARAERLAAAAHPRPLLAGDGRIDEHRRITHQR